MSMSERRLIITGDDFGLSTENNTGIIQAHRYGILSATSLMVGGDAAQEAVELARQHPKLAVGLHISFSDSRPVLPPDQVSMLILPNGRFPPDDKPHQAALRSVKGLRQIRAEIAAQFKQFHQYGLVCDHVNTHRHSLHHPLLAWTIFREASRWPVRATRIPWDPPTDVFRLARATFLRLLGSAYGLKAPDRSINRDWNTQSFPELLANLPTGTTEIFFHPVEACDHRYSVDLPTLLDERIKALLIRLSLCGYTDAITKLPAGIHLPTGESLKWY